MYVTKNTSLYDKFLRNNHVTPSIKSVSVVKSNVQVGYDLIWRYLVYFDYSNESIENAFLVVPFTGKKRHFQSRVKQCSVVKPMAQKLELP